MQYNRTCWSRWQDCMRYLPVLIISVPTEIDVSGAYWDITEFVYDGQYRYYHEGGPFRY